jgi:hypothetical protein
VEVRRLLKIVAVEVDPIRARAQNGRHSAMVAARTDTGARRPTFSICEAEIHARLGDARP